MVVEGSTNKYALIKAKQIQHRIRSTKLLLPYYLKISQVLLFVHDEVLDDLAVGLTDRGLLDRMVVDHQLVLLEHVHQNLK